VSPTHHAYGHAYAFCMLKCIAGQKITLQPDMQINIHFGLEREACKIDCTWLACICSPCETDTPCAGERRIFCELTTWARKCKMHHALKIATCIGSMHFRSIMQTDISMPKKQATGWGQPYSFQMIPTQITIHITIHRQI
jgi:hypothetical protein